MAKVDITVNIDTDKIQSDIDALITKERMIAIHNLFAKLINPWVPMSDGLLSQDLEITDKYVRYRQPYAHYHYIGEVYGPNFPGWEDSSTPGWRSPAGKGSKHPTGRKLGKQGSATLTPVWEIDANGNYVSANPANLINWEFGRDLSKHPLATDHWDKIAMQTQLKLLEAGVLNILRSGE